MKKAIFWEGSIFEKLLKFSDQNCDTLGLAELGTMCGKHSCAVVQVMLQQKWFFTIVTKNDVFTIVTKTSFCNCNSNGFLQLKLKVFFFTIVI